MTAAVAHAYIAAGQAIRSLRNDGFVEDEIPRKDRPAVRKLLGKVASDLFGAGDEPACRVCACTEDAACPGGCAWAEEDLCTACARKTKGRKRRG